jgi:hypothetical protein
MLVALTVNGTTLWAQKPGEAAKAGMAKQPGPVKTITMREWKEPDVPSVVKGVGTLGISVHQIGPRGRYWAGLPDGFGIRVGHVMPSSPAEQAGLKLNDLIVKIDDQWVSNTYQFKALIRHLGPGHKARLLVRNSSMVAGKVGENGGTVWLNPPLLKTEEYIVEAVLGETDGAPLVDPVEPMDWSKPPKKETVRHKGLTFNFRDRMAQAINAEGVIRYQGEDGQFWAKYLPKHEFSDMPEEIGSLPKSFGKVLSIGYEAVEEKPKDDTTEQASKKTP